jgi:hypothetical protein
MERIDMTKPKTTVPPPRAALPDAEPNPYLAKLKASLVKRWSQTRMESLYDQLDLTIFLWAVEREEEALEILRSLTTAIPAPPPLPGGRVNYNVWCPVATANALEARICRIAGDTEAAAAPTARIVADPGVAANPTYISGKVTKANGEFGVAAAKKSVKSACHRLSHTLVSLFLLGELAVAGHEFAAWYDPEEVERLIATGRMALAERLAAA